MATTKNVENARKVTGYESKLVDALEAAVEVGLSLANLDTYMNVYNDLYIAAYNFIEKVALNKYREKLESRGIKPEDIANAITEELFWRKLDYIMNSDDPINCRGLINNTAKLRSYDYIRSDKRAQNDVQAINPDDSEEYNATVDAEYSKANVYFTDVGWNLVASNTDLEEETIAHDECLSILDALKHNKNMFESISFLATKVVGYKASELAVELLARGKTEVYISVLQQVSDLFDLEFGYFTDAAFEIGDAELKYTDVKKLSSEISHGSDRAKNKVRKIMCK